MKSFLHLALIFSSCCVWSAVVGAGQEKCGIGFSGETLSDPFRRELYRSQASANLLAALRAGLLKPAKKYWTEILCLDIPHGATSSIQAANPTPFTTAETLQRVLRDYIAFYKCNSYSLAGFYTPFRAVLDFLQATSQPETIYAFLVDELKENDLVFDSDLIFDALINIKEQFGLGQDSPLLRDVPKAVQQIAMQGKQIRLKNNVTGKYLALNSNSDFVNNGLNTFTLSDQAINAGMNNNNNNNVTSWEFKPVKMPSLPKRNPSMTVQGANLYTFELRQTTATVCSSPALNCSTGSGGMLTVRGFARPQGYDPNPYGVSQRFRLSDFVQFTLVAHDDDVISIELHLDRVYEKHVLAELPDGSVGIVVRGSTIIDGQPIPGLKSYWTVET